jgi:hypothetical protein
VRGAVAHDALRAGRERKRHPQQRDRQAALHRGGLIAGMR